MTNLIACMNNGPLQGKAIRLIGHADPRGTSVYNAALGLKRAERVKQFLVANGIAPGRIETDSMGSDNAMKAPSGWALDRRVEVQLAP